MPRALKTVSGIPFDSYPEMSDIFFRIRHPTVAPLNFEQKVLVDLYGDTIKKAEKVLEIGCGMGRNAQYFIDTNTQYFGFDPSPLGFSLFRKNEYWNLEDEKKFYVSLEIDKTILSQEYDMIFSTYVLQHIGFLKDADVHDSISITETLFPLLRSGGIWLAYERYEGENSWSTATWLKQAFEKNKIDLLSHKEVSLGEYKPHDLIVIRKK